MKKYDVSIFETLAYTVGVEANSPEEAESKVRTMYRNEEIILTGDNWVDTSYDVDEAVEM